MTSQDDIASISATSHGQSAPEVFAIPELLESILLLLPTEDLLISQRVSRTWKTTIDGSKRLRQALFVEAIPPQTAWIARPHSEDGEVLPEEQPDSFKVDKYTVTPVPASSLPQSTPEDQADSFTLTSHLCTLNTLLHHRGHWKQMTLADRIERGEGLRLGRTQKKILGFGRQMFLTQPPCKEVLIWVNWGQPQRIVGIDGEGVRFWQVLEVTKDAGTVVYLPHLFMLAKGVVALTEDEEEMVERKLAKANGGAKGEGEDGVMGSSAGLPAVGNVVRSGQAPRMVQEPIRLATAEWNWVSGTVRRWIGW